MKLSRRELACAALAVVSGGAQTQPQSAPLTPEAELQAAKSQVQAAAEALSQFEIPMATEPAFSFQA